MGNGGWGMGDGGAQLNAPGTGGVLRHVTGMNDLVRGYPGTFVSAATELEREFEERLRDSGTLAFRVAYGVLRHRENAEDVAQEAFAKAHRSFRQLRDRERFRSWLVRMTWRLALDWQ